MNGTKRGGGGKITSNNPNLKYLRSCHLLMTDLTYTQVTAAEHVLSPEKRLFVTRDSDENVIIDGTHYMF